MHPYLSEKDQDHRIRLVGGPQPNASAYQSHRHIQPLTDAVAGRIPQQPLGLTYIRLRVAYVAGSELR